MFEFSEGVYKVVAFCRRRYTKYDFVSSFIYTSHIVAVLDA